MKRLKIDDKVYDFPTSFTLGESRVIQREAGVGLGGIEAAIAEGNADVAACLIYIVLRREDSNVTMADVDARDMVTIEILTDEDDGGQSPPADAAPRSADDEPKLPELESETTRAPSGAPE